MDGKADLYIYPKDGTKRWDTCAPEALIRAVNGSMTDIFGKEYSYLKNEQTLVENCYGIMFSLEKDNSAWVKYMSEELKNQVLNDAEALKQNKLKH